mgnify:CR=1 FL=1
MPKQNNALRLAGHNNIFPTLSWLNGTATLRVWHPRGPDQVEVWAFCITDKAASDEVKAAFEKDENKSTDPKKTGASFPPVPLPETQNLRCRNPVLFVSAALRIRFYLEY